VVLSIAAGEFTQPLDIANRACQHMGARRITSFAQDGKTAGEINSCYDKLRAAELRRNIWTFAIKKCVMRPIDATYGLVTPGTWDATKTYLLGSLVVFNSIIYQARKAVPLNQEPDINPTYWAEAFVSLAAGPWSLQQSSNAPQPWSSGINYAQNAVVVGSDNFQYYSIANGNLGNNPVTDGGVHWQKTGPAGVGRGYFAGEVVYTQTAGAAPQVFISLANNNNDIPTAAPPAFVSTQVYTAGQTVTYSATVYQSTTDFNVGNTPTGTGAWIVQPATQPDLMAGDNWLLLGAATLSSLNIIYPLGTGPSNQAATRNIFKLPNGFLREAPQDPKAGSTNYLGAPSGLAYDDWTFEDGYIISRQVDPMTFRFGADVRDVTTMDPMFCELLGARIALECVEAVTQSAEKLQTIASTYAKFGGEARTVNGIETGSTEPETDDYITCRW
jgi:hypothetical protein